MTPIPSAVREAARQYEAAKALVPQWPTHDGTPKSITAAFKLRRRFHERCGARDAAARRLSDAVCEWLKEVDATKGQ